MQEVTADLAAWRPDYVVVNGDVVNRGPALFCTAHRMFPTWHQYYEQKVREGVLDVETAVDLLVSQVLSSR
jgi:hypothetical protein